MPQTRESLTFSERLKVAREAAGLTQRQVATRLQVRQSTVSGLENGADYSALTPALAKLYGVDHHWLATGEGSPDAILIDGQHRLFSVLAPLNRARSVPGNVHDAQVAQIGVAVQEAARDALMMLPEDERALILAYRALLPDDRKAATAELLRMGSMAIRYRNAARQVSLFSADAGSGRALLDAADHIARDPFAGLDSRKKPK